MELHIKSEFDCVYIINGEFMERANRLRLDEFDTVYITALPLDPMLLPYTVRINVAAPQHGELCRGVRLSPEHYLVTLAPRYMVVYGQIGKPLPPPSTPILRLFDYVKCGDITAAYAMLSEQLKATIDKTALTAFFDGCDSVCECDWETGNKFYMINKNGSCELCSYKMADGFIDDVLECD